VLCELGRYEAARPLIVAAVDVLARSLGPEHPELTAARAVLAGLQPASQTAAEDRATA